MRFHLVDKVISWEPERTVVARKLASHSEDFWESSNDGPVMPPPLVLEALCQAGTWLIMISTDRRKRAALLSVGSVDFLGDVRPGDIVELEGNVESFSDDVAVLSGHATVDGERVMEAKDIMCALMDASELADLDDTERLQKMLTRAGDE